MLDSSNFVRLFHRQSFALYGNRYLQYRQNQLFCTNPKQVFNHRTADMDVPDPSVALDFWRTLWEKTTTHNSNVEWISTIEAELHSLTRQSNLCITLV